MSEDAHHVVRAVILFGVWVWALASGHYVVAALLLVHYLLGWGVEVERLPPEDKARKGATP